MYRKKLIKCRYEVKSPGSCRFGSSCDYLHPGEPGWPKSSNSLRETSQEQRWKKPANPYSSPFRRDNSRPNPVTRTRSSEYDESTWALPPSNSGTTTPGPQLRETTSTAEATSSNTLWGTEEVADAWGSTETSSGSWGKNWGKAGDTGWGSGVSKEDGSSGGGPTNNAGGSSAGVKGSNTSGLGSNKAETTPSPNFQSEGNGNQVNAPSSASSHKVTLDGNKRTETPNADSDTAFDFAASPSESSILAVPRRGDKPKDPRIRTQPSASSLLDRATLPATETSAKVAPRPRIPLPRRLPSAKVPELAQPLPTPERVPAGAVSSPQIQTPVNPLITVFSRPTTLSELYTLMIRTILDSVRLQTLLAQAEKNEAQWKRTQLSGSYQHIRRGGRQKLDELRRSLVDERRNLKKQLSSNTQMLSTFPDLSVIQPTQIAIDIEALDTYITSMRTWAQSATLVLEQRNEPSPKIDNGESFHDRIARLSASLDNISLDDLRDISTMDTQHIRDRMPASTQSAELEDKIGCLTSNLSDVAKNLKDQRDTVNQLKVNLDARQSEMDILTRRFNENLQRRKELDQELLQLEKDREESRQRNLVELRARFKEFEDIVIPPSLDEDTLNKKINEVVSDIVNNEVIPAIKSLNKKCYEFAEINKAQNIDALRKKLEPIVTATHQLGAKFGYSTRLAANTT